MSPHTSSSLHRWTAEFSQCLWCARLHLFSWRSWEDQVYECILGNHPQGCIHSKPTFGSLVKRGIGLQCTRTLQFIKEITRTCKLLTTKYDDQILLWVLISCIYFVGNRWPCGLNQSQFRLHHLRMYAPVVSEMRCEKTARWPVQNLQSFYFGRIWVENVTLFHRSCQVVID